MIPPTIPSDQPPGTVCVYLMTTQNWVKVGIAKDPAWRRVMLQCASPFEVELIEARAFPSLSEARRIETEMHRVLADFRGYGEWFGIKIEVAQHALASMSATSIWRCTDYPASSRRLSPLDKLPDIDPEELALIEAGPEKRRIARQATNGRTGNGYDDTTLAQ